MQTTTAPKSDIDGATGHAQGFGPKRGRRFGHFDDVAKGGDEVVQVLLGGDERRRRLEHHKIVAADLGENSLFAEHAHDDDLTEHGGVNSVEGFIERTEREFLRRGEFDAGEQAHAADLLDEVEAGEGVTQPGAKDLAEFESARAELFAL